MVSESEGWEARIVGEVTFHSDLRGGTRRVGNVNSCP